MTTPETKNWQFTNIWNHSLLKREERPVKPRDRIWASELGKAPIEIWMKMKGIEPSNPPNARSLRKFEAGNIWEWLVSLILERAGILQDAQRWTSYQYQGLVQVTGKLDFVAGGKPDYEKAMREMETLELPEIFVRAGKNIVWYFQQNYPNGLDTKILEIKSISAFMFDIFEEKATASQNHRKQLFHYLKAENYDRGDVVYVCKDDCRMIEIPVLNNEANEEAYKNDIEEISQYYQNNEQPPLADPIVYDEDTERFSKNWNVAYSNYLTKLYGFKNQQEFDNKHKPIVERWNRVLGRIREGKDVTDNNKQAIEEMKKVGFDPYKLIKQ